MPSMSIHYPRDYTPVSDSEAPRLIDWMTVPNEEEEEQQCQELEEWWQLAEEDARKQWEVEAAEREKAADQEGDMDEDSQEGDKGDKGLTSKKTCHVPSTGKGCQLPGSQVQDKQKDNQASPHGGDKWKWPKNATTDDDDDIEIVSSLIAQAGTSAAPELVAQVLNQHLSDITMFLHDLVGKVNNFTNSTGKSKACEVARMGNDNWVTIATNNYAMCMLTGNQANWSPLKRA
ncbi:hypothetical protein PISMIDRAFT_24305 [Pisolithus microcarpus 441]|uniref:Uncharacterized protein n=1 Tax=Pisolithus microcarpus 441 TaxID=765257 RepID=A0A0C9Y5B6_9AGAM|nr:hypothetical protein BKA83DRAFT_24305 [Pisolithus microcarpus]KIK19900.1 hypothetical protein PISMIDRAFT_24305 [Pisolithus microcarpus 441]